MNAVSPVESLVTDHLDLWTAALKRKSTAGRGSSSKVELYGIKKLRELILELAVRGLLVSQDPDDEPASELLKKIAAEKTKLIKAGKIKKDKPLPAISDEVVPFVAPHGWKWARIAEIGYDFGQKTPDADFTYIDVGAIDNRLGLIDCPATLLAEDAPSRARKLVSRGTVIYSTVRPYLLNVAIVQKDFDPEPIASTAFAVVHPFEGVVSGYVYRYLRSPSFVAYVESVQAGIAYPAINDRQFFSGLIPLPPTAEQHRIVAKVDELMVLCDQLEQQTDASLGAHQTLVETLLSALTSAADHAQFTSAWLRIAGHFNMLFTTEESIAQLKQTILQLAVMGKLVAQDPNDEPASELLKKIAAEKTKLVKEGKIKKEKSLPPINREELPHYIPEGWAYERFGRLAIIERGGSPRPIQSFLTDQPDGLNWIKIGDTDIGGKYITTTKEKITKEGLAKTRMVYPGDFLLTNSMSFGRPYITKIEGCIHDGWLRISPAEQVDKNYLYLLLSSPYIVKSFTESAAGAVVQNLNSDKVREVLILLPPLAEQHRIVVKVDELMALCDQLKSRFSDAQTTQFHLADALVEQAIG